jgi:hypothetical protein
MSQGCRVGCPYEFIDIYALTQKEKATNYGVRVKSVAGTIFSYTID